MISGAPINELLWYFCGTSVVLSDRGRFYASLNVYLPTNDKVVKVRLQIELTTQTTCTI